jgi:hypothetical protein
MDTSPAKILRQLLIDLNVAGEGTNWDIYYSNMPDNPNNCICIYDTLPINNGRIQLTGEQVVHPGIMIHIRHSDYEDGYKKALSLCETLDEGIYTDTVEIEEEFYLVHAFCKRNGPNSMGRDPISNRLLFSINGQITISKL